MRSFTRQRLLDLYTRRIPAGIALSDIRDNSNITDLEEAIREIEKKAPEALRILIREPKLRSYGDLHRPSLRPGPLKSELNLLTSILRRSVPTLNEFIGRRSAFDKLLLAGNYNAARNHLSEIKAVCGPSCWSIEQELILAQLADGLEANKALLASITDESKNQITRTIAGMISSRIESNVSWETFRDQALKFKSVNRKHAAIVSYILAKVNYIEEISDVQIEHILHWTNTASCCDGYNTLLALSRLAKAKTLKCASAIKEACNRVATLINDPILHHLIAAHTPDTAPMISKDVTSMVSAYDLALTESWEPLKTATSRFIRENPTIFEFYQWHAIACSHLAPTSHPPVQTNSLSGTIISALINIECLSPEMDTALTALKKVSMILGHRALGYKIDAYWRRYTEGDRSSDTFTLATIACNASTPSVALTFATKRESLSSIQAWIKAYPESTYLRVMQSFFLPKEQVDESDFSLPLVTRKLLSIQRAIYHDNPGLASDEAEQLLLLQGDDVLSGRNVYDDDLFQKLVIAFFNTAKDHLAVKVLTRALQSKRIAISQLLDSLHHQAGGKPSLLARRSIYTPIFKAICGGTTSHLYVAFANFCELHHIRLPSSLNDTHSFSEQELIWFWHRACILEVLEKWDYIDLPDQAEDERLLILKHLQSKDPVNGKAYSDEAVKLTQRRLIKKGLTEVDSSRVDIGVQALKETNDVKWRELFARYVEFASFKHHIPRNAIAGGELDLDSITEAQIEQLAEKKDILFSLYLEFFEDIKREFLHNKIHGLHASLSTRIRHGFAVRHIRGMFEESKLLFAHSPTFNVAQFTKSLSAEWPMLQNPDEIAVPFARFSERVNATATKLVDNILRIKDRTNAPEGLFDYTFEEGELYGRFSRNFTSGDYDSFIDRIFSFLLQRTDKCLTEIRKYLHSSVSDELSFALSQLESDTVGQGQDNRRVAKAIADSRANLFNGINRISDWFQISQGTGLLDGDLELAATIAQIIVTSPDINKYVETRRVITTGVKVTSRYFCSFVYLLSILLDNAIKYGHLENGKIRIELTLAYKEGKITIKVRNSASTSKAKDESELVAARIQALTANPNARGVGEGGSGLAKIIDIIEGDFRRSDYTFSAHAEKSFLTVEAQFESFPILIP